MVVELGNQLSHDLQQKFEMLRVEFERQLNRRRLEFEAQMRQQQQLAAQPEGKMKDEITLKLNWRISFLSSFNLSCICFLSILSSLSAPQRQEPSRTPSGDGSASSPLCCRGCTAWGT